MGMWGWARFYLYLFTPAKIYTRQPSTTWPVTRRIALGALAAALAAMLQSAGVLLPGFGQVVGAFSSIPLIVITLLTPGTGTLTVLTATGLVSLFHPLGGLVLALTYGPLGLAMGLMIHYRLPRLAVIPLCAIVLAAGIGTLAFGLGLPAFTILKTTGVGVSLLLVVGMTLLYSWLWLDLVEAICARLPFFSTRPPR